MAASIDWRQVLNKHRIFKQLQSCLGKVKPEIESKSILTIHDGQLFVWNAYNSTILTINLKLLVGKSETEISEDTFQTLLYTPPPIYEVNSLQLSASGSYLAVVGRRGLTAVELPQRWGKHAQYEGGKEQILCRAHPVAERFFLSNNESVLQVAWHPGSENEMLLMVLLSDNTLRLYNLETPQSSLHTYHLTKQHSMMSPMRLRVQDALGEAATAFDFGLATELQSKKKPSQTVRLGGADSLRHFVWPVYVLWGNGDVYVLNSRLPSKTASGTQPTEYLRGPLSMYPAAEDNYGTDACDIGVLYTQPPTVVIATAEGKLHHCVLLNETAGDDDTLSEASFSSSSVARALQHLYVYETLELELSLSTLSVDLDSSIQDEFSCPIRIYKDGSCADRYHCSHSAGVHTVALPWQQKISQFCEDDNRAEPPSLSESEHALVEHLICTKPLSASPPCPVLGLSVIADRLLGSNLLCLTNTYECVVLPLVPSYKQRPPQLLSEKPSAGSLSPIRKLHSQRETFDSHIKKILQRSASNPLLKTSAKTDLGAEQCVLLLGRATQVFREEYLQKQDLAREEIEKRMRILREHKAQQASDLRDLQNSRLSLSTIAERLAEKYEEAKDTHERIIQRTELVLRKLQLRLPVLTEAEKNMQAELKDLEESLRTFRTRTEQLKAKMQYQKREISKGSRQHVGQSAGFTKTQSQQLRTVLRQEGEEISSLVNQVNQLKLTLEV